MTFQYTVIVLIAPTNAKINMKANILAGNNFFNLITLSINYLFTFPLPPSRKFNVQCDELSSIFA